MLRPAAGGCRGPAPRGGGCVLVLVLAGCSRSSVTAAAAPRSPGTEYTLMQMNLCLSGLAGCYGKVQYPAVLNEAIARIREAQAGRGHLQRGLQR